MNKEITPNEIANAIRDLLEERDEFQERLKEQDKSLQNWYNHYHKLKNKYDKQKEVLNRLKVVYTSMQFSAPENMYTFIEQMGDLLEEIE